ncbi:FCD domain-containing protein [Geodermatophilus sp. YIM 151500]|uniref:FadR/GntR family transcriptional regulator n=1 Tax=Geodermatophilus sp. YIM 151500 TaxID=2984531 RepID=UPI0021E3BD9B|nr:FCD domain-containing protein [Geodermatophilus sp. YIM 151500]MCV2488260.1 FCD domain-containing protein [Geodermatophilus sp. YIM 151500]
MTSSLRSSGADAALFRPLRGGNAFEETVERLLQALRLGVVAPGGRLPPGRELAARLGVSRATLREALATLQDAGYLESRRGRYGGTFVRAAPPADRIVRSPSGAELDDVLQFRLVLEEGAAEAAAARALTRAEREHLSSRLAACTGAPLADYRRLDSRLHLAVAEVAGSPSLTTAVADVRIRVNELLDAIPLLPPNIEHSDRQHAAVVTAILAGDPDGARRHMAEHLAGTAALLRGFLT